MMFIRAQPERSMSLSRRSFDREPYIPISNKGMLPSNTQCRDDAAEKLRTVECLRRRLQAERVASKEAKEVTQVIDKKLEDLEKKLNDEIKSRNKAEKRLRHALRKLESLKILGLPDSSIGSFSSYCSSANEGFDDKRTNSVKTDNDSPQCSSFEEVKEEKNGLSGSENESWCSIGSELSHLNDENCEDRSTENCGSEEEFHANKRQSSVSTTSVVKPKAQVEDNKLAVVSENTETRMTECTNKAKIKDNNVHSVLLALRQVREQLQYSIERRSSISSMKELYGH